MIVRRMAMIQVGKRTTLPIFKIDSKKKNKLKIVKHIITLQEEHSFLTDPQIGILWLFVRTLFKSCSR